jgi:hypothetical protein
MPTAHLKSRGADAPPRSSDADVPTDQTTAPACAPQPPSTQPREIGGRGGPDPTRFGDWEKNGRCIDF